MYDWVLRWAESPHGAIALFVLAFVESVFFPIPPDVLLIALAFVGYGLGYYMWTSPSGDYTVFANFFFANIPGFTVALFENIRALFNQWNFWIIFTAGFTPIPYKVFTVTAGVFDINLLMFFIASIISRGARFFLIAWLIWKFGPSIKQFIEKYFNSLVMGASAVLIGGFVLIKYAI
jgi:membrane protein YqaA with SNARE-associated domain